MIQVVCALVVNQSFEVLLAKRKDVFEESSWEFPGGKVEKNESHEEALIREIKEELGMTIKVHSEVTQEEILKNGKKIGVLTGYFCSSGELPKKLLSHSEYKITPVFEVDPNILLLADRKILNHAQEAIRQKVILG